MVSVLQRVLWCVTACSVLHQHPQHQLPAPCRSPASFPMDHEGLDFRARNAGTLHVLSSIPPGFLLPHLRDWSWPLTLWSLNGECYFWSSAFLWSEWRGHACLYKACTLQKITAGGVRRHVLFPKIAASGPADGWPEHAGCCGLMERGQAGLWRTL